MRCLQITTVHQLDIQYPPHRKRCEHRSTSCCNYYNSHPFHVTVLVVVAFKGSARQQLHAADLACDPLIRFDHSLTPMRQPHMEW